MKPILLLYALLCTPLLGVPDDGNQATIRARFSCDQVVSEVVTKYRFTVWKADQTPAQGVVLEVPRPADPNAKIEVIEDGFIQGGNYKFYATAASETDESDSSIVIGFRVSIIIPPPSLPKVEIQVSADLGTWKTIALVPLTEEAKFVRARIAKTTE